MFRLIAFFLYICGYLLYSIPTLRKVKKLDPKLSVEVRDRMIHELPKKWSSTIMKITGSEIVLHGEEHIPDGPVVFVANHEGDFDIPLLLSTIEKPFGFISKIEVKKAPIISSWMEVMNCVFLDRDQPRQQVKAIREGIELLKKGHSIVIFPEGTRNRGNAMLPFKGGSFKLAKDAQVPIVPICIKGTADVFENNGRLIKPTKITVSICQAIEPNMIKDKNLNELANEVQALIEAELNKHKIAS